MKKKIISLLMVILTIYGHKAYATDENAIPEEFIANDAYASKAETIVIPLYENGKSKSSNVAPYSIVMTGTRTSTWFVMIVSTTDGAIFVGKLNVRNSVFSGSTIEFSGKGMNDIDKKSVNFTCSANSKEFEFSFYVTNDTKTKKSFILTTDDKNCPISVNENIALSANIWDLPGWKLASLEQIFICLQHNNQL